MSVNKIMVVEDEQDILELIQYNLAREGYEVVGFCTAEEALEATKNMTPDLIILDLMLPGMDGLDFCKIMRITESTRGIPIIMLTAKGEEADIVAGLEIGADDYIPKPFSPRVLIARIRAILRRTNRRADTGNAVLKRHELTIDPGRRQALLNEKPVDLTFSEFQILHFLTRKPGWVFTRNQIIDAVHGEDYPVTDRSVDVQIVSLRKKLGDCGKYINTVRGVGYRFQE